jgi:hypothetical protein
MNLTPVRTDSPQTVSRKAILTLTWVHNVEELSGDFAKTFKDHKS